MHTVKKTSSIDTCVAREYMMRYVVHLVLPPDIKIFKEYESLRRVAPSVIVSSKTELLFELLMNILSE